MGLAEIQTGQLIQRVCWLNLWVQILLPQIVPASAAMEALTGLYHLCVTFKVLVGAACESYEYLPGTRVATGSVVGQFRA